ncbi:hypothetical protein [Bradyrhizobium sp.]|uniref:hypothetical protein n=1 Tax=Bradyrhizobium sp. TaxID=376 RepID=UPI0025B84704|nr:hypothetical protein [Bradyrhizobium sp.]
MTLLVLDAVLDAVLLVFGIRGHIPQNDGFPNGRSRSSFAVNTGTLMRVLAAAVVSIGFLVLALWAAVWLALKLL